MAEQNEQSAAPQVIYIVQAPKERLDLRDVYNVKAATVLGVVHIICGIIALSSDIVVMVDDSNISLAAGIWTSVFFFISGGLAIGGARSGNKCLVVATMVMAIISAVCAGALLIQSAILVSIFGSRRSYHYHRDQGQLELVSYVLMITMGVTMLISAITSASLTCRPLCCSPTKQGVVHYRPNNQVNQVSEANATSVVLNVDELGKFILPAVQDMQAIPTNSPRVSLIQKSRLSRQFWNQNLFPFPACFGLKRASRLSRCCWSWK